MFNFFRVSDYKQSEPVTPITPLTLPKDDSIEDAMYTIGVNEQGYTQLRMRSAYGSTTLSMNPRAVRQLIRMLELTIEDNTKEETDD